MILGFDLRDLPGDAITVLLLLLVSFFGWLKNRFEQHRTGPAGPTADDDDGEIDRDVIWRRQVGEADDRAPWETDPTVWHPDTATPPPLPPAPEPPAPEPPTPVAPAPAPQLSEKEKRLAEAFERGTTRRRSRRTALSMSALRSPQASRRAVILAEILGPPLALRDPSERRP